MKNTYTFKFKLDFSKILQEGEKEPNIKQVFLNIFDAALSSAYRDGLGKDLMRRSFNIGNKIEDAEGDTVELSDAEYELLKEAFERAKLNSNVKKLLIQVYDNIDEAKKAHDTAE